MTKIVKKTLAESYPDLVNELHPTKNAEYNYKPEELSVGSHKKVFWYGKCGHEWESCIRDRIRAKGTGCPYCSHRIIIRDNSLAAEYPNLISEWHQTKNGDLTPYMVAPHSAKIVWWQCNKNHEWESRIANRTNKNARGCPICNSERRTSFPEYAIYFYIKKMDPNAVHSYIFYGTQELDIYIPSMKIGIEYDGYYFHKKINKRDIIKNQKCKELGIKLYRVREKGLDSLNSTSVDIICDRGVDDAIRQLVKAIYGNDIEVNIEKDKKNIEELQVFMDKENSLTCRYPDIAKQWHLSKNGKRNPDNTSCFYSKKVWWMCDLGHEYQATTGHRIEGTGCPFCANNSLLIGFNDLATKAPNVAEEWHPTKNGNVNPTDVIAYSPKKYWWLGKCGHEWITQVNSRVAGSQCPICANRIIVPGVNDLESWAHKNGYIYILNEWDNKKNGDLKPSEVAVCSAKRIWWKCAKCGNGWRVKIAERTSVNKSGCPYCVNQKIKTGYNDLLSQEPELCKEWNYAKNIKISPSEISCNSGKKVWWRCSYGHDWEATVDNRRGKGKGCPFCKNKKVLAGFNDLQTYSFEIAKDWNYEKNNTLLPSQVLYGSNKKVWWKCHKCGYEWQAMVCSRTKRNSKCKNCNK